MARLAQPRHGSPVQVKGRPLTFSYWPMYKSPRRFGLQSSLFVRDPWTVIKDAAQARCPGSALDEALACLEQAKDFYSSAMAANVSAARPLQLYYCFLNLAKSLALTMGVATTFDGAQHGLSERLRGGRRELLDAYLEVSPPGLNGRHQVFAALYRTISGADLPRMIPRLDLTALLPQILPGHRLWADAADRIERFVSVHELRPYEDRMAGLLWLSLYFAGDDLSRLGVTHHRLLGESGLEPEYREVKCSESVGGRSLICFEQNTPATFTDRPSDEVPKLMERTRPHLWTIVGTSPPYRKYYVYMAPAQERHSVLPQILSVYAVMYYLGSITRYRPQHFDKILSGPFGSQIEEFIAGQPTQFIYLVASEFAKREVTQPAIV